MGIDSAKQSFCGKPKYILKNATVYQSEEGYTFSKYLDDEHAEPTELSKDQSIKLTEYLSAQLEYNSSRFSGQVQLLKKYIEISGSKVLDVGCGGGAFIVEAKKAGFDIAGVELDINRARHARNVSGCEIIEKPITEEKFRRDRRGSYSAITLWDVIEHVNYPERLIDSVGTLLMEGGVFCIDTPAKDAFYHKVGEQPFQGGISSLYEPGS